MAEVMTSAQRSRCMSRIRGRDTKPEILLRSVLWRRGMRFRTKSRLPGKPDIVFPTERTVVFVDGCFWHCCPEHKTRPATNAEFWGNKLSENVSRDRRNDALLAAKGWTVVRVWEHEVEKTLEQVGRRLAELVLAKRAEAQSALDTRRSGNGKHKGTAQGGSRARLDRRIRSGEANP